MPQPALKVRYPLSNPTLIEAIVRRGLPLLNAEEANEELVRLTLANMVLRAKLDAIDLRLRNFVEGCPDAA